MPLGSRSSCGPRADKVAWERFVGRPQMAVLLLPGHGFHLQAPHTAELLPSAPCAVSAADFRLHGQHPVLDARNSSLLGLGCVDLTPQSPVFPFPQITPNLSILPIPVTPQPSAFPSHHLPLATTETQIWLFSPT